MNISDPRNHMRLASPLDPSQLHCYLLHHGVALESKPRVVFSGKVFYVDDLLTSTDTVEQAVMLIELIKLLVYCTVVNRRRGLEDH